MDVFLVGSRCELVNQANPLVLGKLGFQGKKGFLPTGKDGCALGKKLLGKRAFLSFLFVKKVFLPRGKGEDVSVSEKKGDVLLPEEETLLFAQKGEIPSVVKDLFPVIGIESGEKIKKGAFPLAVGGLREERDLSPEG